MWEDCKLEKTFLEENKKTSEELEEDFIIRRFQKYPNKKKKEVVQFFCQHGKEATLEKYKISNPKRLQNWRKKFQSEMGEFKKHTKRKISVEEVAFREAVIGHSNIHGVKAAAKRFNVSSPKIWDWRTRAKQAGMKLTERVGVGELSQSQDIDFIPDEEKITSTDTETDCDPFLPDNIKLEDAVETTEIDIKYNSISMTDLMHVDTQLLKKKETWTGGAGIVRIKTESIMDLKIEIDEVTPRPRSSSEI